MAKDLKDDLIDLSITSLINCLEDLNVKDQFVKETPKSKYEQIIKFMREESTVIQMRDFHNWVKLVLISNITDFYYRTAHKEKVSLLDISTGRGGDLSKWKKAYISHVFAFDISEQSINSTDPENQGAKERLKGLKKKGYSVNVDFEVGDASNPSTSLITGINTFLKSNKLGKFDLVSCQFALHYYFSSENALRNVLSLVSNYLVRGGYFFGTTIDGEKIKSYFDYLPEGTKVFKRKLYRIDRYFPKKLKSPFGNRYDFTIYDTFDKTNYFNVTGTSTEYLVNFDVLTKLAKEYSLIPVITNFFEKWSPTGKKNEYTSRSDNHIPFQEIFETGKWEPYTKGATITPDELELSFLNSTFCFQKI
jgi:mRNA (guanine-N7-)-methyltransferase